MFDTARQSGYAFVGAAFFVAMGLGVYGVVMGAGDRITICHATSSPDNPYVEITVNVSANGDLPGHREHLGDKHDVNHEDDVIPPYSVTLEDGTVLSFPPQGDQSPLARGCDPNGDPSPSGTGSPSTTPSGSPSESPSWSPSVSPSGSPSETPSGSPSQSPYPTSSPSITPNVTPTGSPTPPWSPSISSYPTWSPTWSPSWSPPPQLPPVDGELPPVDGNEPTPVPTLAPTL